MNKHNHSLLLRALAFIALLGFTGSVLAQIESISVSSASNLDSDFTAEVDIVFIYSDDALNQLPFEQFAWISTREEQIEKFAEEIDVVSLNLEGSFDDFLVELPSRQAAAIAVLVFASHEDPVVEGIDVTGEAHLKLVIESWGVFVE